METNAPTFTRDDISAASGLNQTQIENLVRLGIAPESESRGRGAARRYASDALAQFAVIGAVFDAGVDLVQAARLMVALNETIVIGYNGVHDNLDSAFRNIHGETPWLKEIPCDKTTYRFDRYSLFAALRRHVPDADLCVSRSGDLIIEIINRSYVFSSVFSDGSHPIKFFSPFGDASDVQAEFRLMGWERGSTETRIISVADELPNLGDDDESNAAYKKAGRAIEEEYRAARNNAVSALRFNVSAAVRRGFEAVFTKRNPTNSEIVGSADGDPS